MRSFAHFPHTQIKAYSNWFDSTILQYVHISKDFVANDKYILFYLSSKIFKVVNAFGCKHLTLTCKCVLSVPMVIKRRHKDGAHRASGGNASLPKEQEFLWRNWETCLKVLKYTVKSPIEESAIELQPCFRQAYMSHIYI